MAAQAMSWCIDCPTGDAPSKMPAGHEGWAGSTVYRRPSGHGVPPQRNHEVGVRRILRPPARTTKCVRRIALGRDERGRDTSGRRHAGAADRVFATAHPEMAGNRGYG